MNYLKYDIVFQEIPGEISLAFYITGCPLRCPGCHSPELWNPANGSKLTEEILQSLLVRYGRALSCVLFMGGEWEPETLTHFLQIIRQQSLKTALYTGREIDELPMNILTNLNYLKTGPWRAELGGLQSPRTNQKLHHFTEDLCS